MECCWVQAPRTSNGSCAWRCGTDRLLASLPYLTCSEAPSLPVTCSRQTVGWNESKWSLKVFLKQLCKRERSEKYFHKAHHVTSLGQASSEDSKSWRREEAESHSAEPSELKAELEEMKPQNPKTSERLLEASSVRDIQLLLCNRPQGLVGSKIRFWESTSSLLARQTALKDLSIWSQKVCASGGQLFAGVSLLPASGPWHWELSGADFFWTLTNKAQISFISWLPFTFSVH